MAEAPIEVQVTITAPMGPGRQADTQLLLHVQKILFDFTTMVVQVHLDNTAGNQIKEYDLATVRRLTSIIEAAPPTAAGGWAIQIFDTPA